MNKSLLFYIDDDSDDLSTFLYVAKSMGIQVRLFSTGTHLLTHIRESDEKPSAILVDLNMPLITGFEVIEEISKNQSLITVPIVAFSTAGDRTSITKAKEAGATCYIKKPRTVSGFRQNLKLITELDWSQHDPENSFLMGK
jgi:FixJ family two-component response regulator